MNSSTPVWAIDANVILRFLLKDDDSLFPKATGILRSVEEGGSVVCCDPVALAECVWVLQSHYQLPREEIASGLATIVKLPGLLMANKARYLRALELFGRSVKHFGDACACAAALEDCEGRLYSFDRKLSAVEGIERRETVTG